MSQLATFDNDVVNEVRLAASVATFESTELGRFRSRLIEALQTAIVTLEAKHSGWNHYPSSLETILYSGIPWTELLAHSRRRSQHHASKHDGTVPLNEVIGLVVSPTVIPYALSSSISMVFFRVIIEDTTATKSASQHPLLPALRQLLETRPAARQVGSAWIAYIQSHLLLQPNNINTYSVEQAYRVVSVCKHLVSSMDEPIILKCLLKLLQSIDDVDIHLLQSRRKTKMIGSRSCPCQTKRNTGRRSRRIAGGFDLDGDLDDEADASGLAVSTVTVAVGGTVERVSRITHSMPFMECYACRIQKSSRGITQLSIQLVMLRSRLYQKLLSIFHQQTMQRTQRDLRNSRRVEEPSSLLSTIIYYVCQHPESPSLRLCTALLADCLSLRGHNYVIRSFWLLYEQRTSTIGEAVLRIYSEILVHCSHFDDPNRCWEALIPLLNHVADLCGTGQRSEAEADPKIRSHICLILRCLTFILHHHQHAFVVFETKPMWQELVSKLSLVFEEEDWWVSNTMSQTERAETLSTLQAIGILGFLMNESPLAAGEDLAVQATWPFVESLSICGAYRRAGPNIGRDGLLSNPSARTSEPPQRLLVRQDKDDDCLIGTPIMDYLNDDLLRIIFSFLGYKRLVKASGICKAWMSLVNNNELWRQAYMARFPIQKDNGLVSVSTDPPFGSWKTYFVNKVLAEKALRFKRHSSGWKHRTCGYVGCLMVLRSPRQMEAHYRTHRKRQIKQSASKSTASKRTKLSKATKLCNDIRSQRCKETQARTIVPYSI